MTHPRTAANPKKFPLIYSAMQAGVWLVREMDLTMTQPTTTHEHGVVQVLVMLEGGFDLHDRLQRYPLRPGSVAVIPADVPHGVDPAPETRRSLLLDLQLDAPRFQPMAEYFGALGITCQHLAPAIVARCREQLHAAAQFPDRARTAATLAALWPLLTAFLLAAHPPRPPAADTLATTAAITGDTRLALAESHLIERLHTPTLTLESLAQAARLSTSQLTRLYRQHVGISPARRIEQMRIQRSLELLGSGALSIKQIATACGFAGTSQFSRAFKRVTGHRPAQVQRGVM